MEQINTGWDNDADWVASGSHERLKFVENKSWQGYNDIQHSLHTNAGSMTPCAGHVSAAAAGFTQLSLEHKLVASSQQAWVDNSTPWSRIESAAHAPSATTRLRVENVFTINMPVLDEESRNGAQVYPFQLCPVISC
jgi:hypothetical protein